MVGDADCRMDFRRACTGATARSAQIRRPMAISAADDLR
jgi:hypothetical protein